MKLTVLGINGPFPAPGGACSGYLLTSDSGKTKVLIECGAGILGRMERFVDLHELSGIVLSHLLSALFAVVLCALAAVCCLPRLVREWRRILAILMAARLGSARNAVGRSLSTCLKSLIIQLS